MGDKESRSRDQCVAQRAELCMSSDMYRTVCMVLGLVWHRGSMQSSAAYPRGRVCMSLGLRRYLPRYLGKEICESVPGSPGFRLRERWKTWDLVST